jgi:hypothetical protein
LLQLPAYRCAHRRKGKYSNYSFAQTLLDLLLSRWTVARSSKHGADSSHHAPNGCSGYRFVV